MLKFVIPKIEYITAHPLTWSDDVRQFLKVEIVDTREVDALRSLPAQRALGSDIYVNRSLLRAVGLSSRAPKYSGFGGFLHRCINSVKTGNGKPVDVSFSPDPIELRLPTGRVLLPAKYYNYRGIPFLSYIIPEDVRRARCALHISDKDDDTFAITSYYLATLIALSQQALKFLEQKRDAYPVIDHLSRTVAILIFIGTGRLSNRRRQANHRPYRPCSGLIPREIRNGHHSDRSLAGHPYHNHDRRRQQYT